MGVMLDTSVAIPLRDGDLSIRSRLHSLNEPILLPSLTLAELEAGARGQDADIRRGRLEVLIETFEVIPFQTEDARAYGDIVRALGFSRSKVLARMIAAQAIVAGATLATLNPADFRDIPGLSLLEW